MFEHPFTLAPARLGQNPGLRMVRNEAIGQNWPGLKSSFIASKREGGLLFPVCLKAFWRGFASKPQTHWWSGRVSVSGWSWSYMGFWVTTESQKKDNGTRMSEASIKRWSLALQWRGQTPRTYGRKSHSTFSVDRLFFSFLEGTIPRLEETWETCQFSWATAWWINYIIMRIMSSIPFS